jgi:hypothetical protein
MNPSSPKERPYSGKQLANAERLDQIIVRTGIKPANRIPISGTTGHHNHTHILSFRDATPHKDPPITKTNEVDKANFCYGLDPLPLSDQLPAKTDKPVRRAPNRTIDQHPVAVENDQLEALCRTLHCLIAQARASPWRLPTICFSIASLPASPAVR